jgi:RNA polymerase sigma factor (TIGR02999 family)
LIAAPHHPPPGELTTLLHRWAAGDPQAVSRLMPLVYADLRRIAARHLRREHDPRCPAPTELVHEIFLRLRGAEPVTLESRGHFFGIAARITRQVLADQARERSAKKRGGGAAHAPLDESVDGCQEAAASVLALHEAINELARADLRKARMIEMRFFGGLEATQIAEALGVSESTVVRDLRVARSWLHSYLSA